LAQKFGKIAAAKFDIAGLIPAISLDTSNQPSRKPLQRDVDFVDANPQLSHST